MFSFKKNSILYICAEYIPRISEENKERHLPLVVGLVGTSILVHWIVNLTQEIFTEVLETIDQKKKLRSFTIIKVNPQLCTCQVNHNLSLRSSNINVYIMFTLIKTKKECIYI